MWYVRLFVSLAFCGLLVGCGNPSSQSRVGEGTFADQAGRPNQKDQLPADDNKPSDTTTAQNQSAPPVQVNTPPPQNTTASPAPTQTAPPVTVKPEELPLVTKGKAEIQLSTYSIPEKVKERIRKYQPELVPEESPDFTVYNQHQVIDKSTKTVTFRGVLRVSGKKDEPFKLSCQFDPEATPWVCTDMVPIDKKIAAERRFQATWKCLDPNICQMTAIKLWVVIDGKLQAPQIFQRDAFQIRRASSGDAPEQILSLTDETKAQPSEPLQLNSGVLPGIQDQMPKEPKSTPAPATPAPLAPQAPAPTPPPQETQQPTPEPPPAQTAPTPPAQEPASGPIFTQPPQEPAVTPAPAPSTPQENPPLKEQEVETLLKDPDASIEIVAPMTMPTPTANDFSVPGVESLPKEKVTRVPIQAVGWHTRGHLEKAAEFEARGPGFVSRDHGRYDFAADITVQLIENAIGFVYQVFPDRPPFIIGNVAKKLGGPFGHKSHQTGLDADIGLPSKAQAPSFFSACLGSCNSGRIVQTFDRERFWFLIKSLTCNDDKPVIAMFLDRSIKREMCRYVKQEAKEDFSSPKSCAFRALQALRHEDGHDNHVHVRLRCPENSACQNSWVTLTNSPGC